jgi:7-cyano-7-deazaguanine synthase in queuosine biosynthesis
MTEALPARLEVNMGTYDYALFSGGLESTYALVSALESNPEKRIAPIHIDYGQFASNYERTAVKRIIDLLKTSTEISARVLAPIYLDIGKVFSWTESVAYTGNVLNSCPEIENRNMVIISIIYSYLLSKADLSQANKFILFTGFKDGEMPDANKDFFNHLSSLCMKYRPNQMLSFELLKNESRDNIKHYLCATLKRLGINSSNLLALLASCYAPKDGQSCNVCYKCKSDTQRSKQGSMGDWN